MSNKGHLHEREIGFIVYDKIFPNAKKFEAINDRICYLDAQGEWFNIEFIVTYYAPTEDNDVKKKN